jgi:hypothetical protein
LDLLYDIRNLKSDPRTFQMMNKKEKYMGICEFLIESLEKNPNVKYIENIPSK